MNEIDLSVVAPVFNEGGLVAEFHRRLAAVLDGLGLTAEVIYVDDGSSDDTPAALEALRRKDPRVRVVEFSRNFGHQCAISAGLDRAAGRACVLIDTDLQDPPELVPKMVEEWKAGFEVVYAVRASREGEGLFKRGTAALFYRLLSGLAGVDIPRNTGDFRLLDRRVVEALRSFPERNRFLRGLVSWVGFRQKGVPFERPPRAGGETKYSLVKMVRLALDGITSFSHLPLRLVTFLGFGCSLVSVVLLGWTFYVKFVAHRSIQGWTSLIGVVLLLGGAQLLALGILGEYVSRIFDESKRRPLYVVRRTAGFSEKD
jgi:dolichol-phosphate mannosyltransferase